MSEDIRATHYTHRYVVIGPGFTWYGDTEDAVMKRIALAQKSDWPFTVYVRLDLATEVAGYGVQHRIKAVGNGNDK